MKKDIVFFDDFPEELNPELYKPRIDPSEEKRLEEEEKQKKREEMQKKREERWRRLWGRKG